MNIKPKLIAALCTSVLIVAAPAYSADTIKTDAQKFGYAVGYQIGQNLKNQGLGDVDVKALSQAITDVLKEQKLKLSMDEMQKAVQGKQEKMLAERNAKGDKAKEAGAKFLAENKKKPGIVTLESGIQYKVITEGKGQKPTLNDTVVAHYRGTHK